MRTIGLLFVASALLAQVAPEDRDAIAQINATLFKLRVSASVKEELVSEILALAERAHKPSRRTVAGFVDELADTLAGRNLSTAEISQLTAPVYDVLRSAGDGAFRFQDHIRQAEHALIALHVSPSKARMIAANLTAIGKEVRGPDDIGR